MRRYIIRLDDACNRRDAEKWNRVEKLLDKYGIKPLIGVIPNCEDKSMSEYEDDPLFWYRVSEWQYKGWEIALHGYSHVYCSESGGINPVNNRSEFAGLPKQEQLQKLIDGLAVFKEHNISTSIFFAPSHTFDENTLLALRETGQILMISDTIASNIYWRDGFIFIPQQSGHCCKLPVKVSTFCFHPNVMSDNDFCRLEKFLQKESKNFICPSIEVVRSLAKPKRTLYDVFLSKIYFSYRKIRTAFRG